MWKSWTHGHLLPRSGYNQDGSSTLVKEYFVRYFKDTLCIWLRAWHKAKLRNQGHMLPSSGHDQEGVNKLREKIMNWPYQGASSFTQCKNIMEPWFHDLPGSGHDEGEFHLNENIEEWNQDNHKFMICCHPVGIAKMASFTQGVSKFQLWNAFKWNRVHLPPCMARKSWTHDFPAFLALCKHALV